jgi:hypothetical protein
MSKYMSFESEAFANRELLVEALKDIGLENVTVGTALLLKTSEHFAEIKANELKDALTRVGVMADDAHRKSSSSFLGINCCSNPNRRKPEIRRKKSAAHFKDCATLKTTRTKFQTVGKLPLTLNT